MENNYTHITGSEEWYNKLSDEEKKQADILFDSTQQHPRAHLAADEAEIESELALLQTKTTRIGLRSYYTKILMAAAAIILAFGLSWTLYKTPIVHEASYGEIITVTLPDGSIAEINSGSKISHSRFGFGNLNRKIHLIGEAYFDVKSSETPLTIYTHNATLAVLGTSFSVRSWDTDVNMETSVYLESGSLRFASSSYPEKQVLLEPGQLSTVNLLKPVPTEPLNIPSEQGLAWRNRGMYFSSVPISVVLADLERRFNTSIEVANAEILNESLSLFMRSPNSAEHVIAAIAAERNLRYEIQNGKILLFASN